MLPTQTLDMFAGMPVSNFAEARKWYERLLGSPPSFLPHDTEAVWELAEHRYIYIVEMREHAGHGRLTLFVDDLGPLVGKIGERGPVPSMREVYPNGVRKISYRDPDGNEIGFGGPRTRRPRRGARARREVRRSARPPQKRRRTARRRPAPP